jgi:hypothetical protein
LKRFADWKCNVRKKARKLALSQVKTGGGPPDTPLTNTENRLLDLTGRAVANGLENIPELGLEGESYDIRMYKVIQGIHIRVQA